jgi:hypothetical protein
MTNPAPSTPEPSDEIDLGQLFRLIGNGFRNLFRWFLSVYLYFKRHFYWFAGLVLLGGLTGYLAGQFLDDKQQIEVIVTPNQDEANYLFNTRTYLYDVVEEVQAKIKGKDSAFFESLGMDFEKMKGFEIEVTPLISQNTQIRESEERILEALQEFGNSEALSEIAVAEFRNQSIRDHRLFFYYKDPTPGKEYVGKMLEYLNSNAYYTRLVQIQKENAQRRIEQNDSLIAQIDKLVEVYTGKINRDRSSSEGQLFLENREVVNVPALLTLKNELIVESETKRLENEMKQDPVTIVSVGEPHKIVKPLFQKNLVFFPLLFVGAFLLFSLIRYLNGKAEELDL